MIGLSLFVQGQKVQSEKKIIVNLTTLGLYVNSNKNQAFQIRREKNVYQLTA